MITKLQRKPLLTSVKRINSLFVVFLLFVKKVFNVFKVFQVHAFSE